MPENESGLIRAIRDRASRRWGEMACELARAESKDKELVLAEMDYQRSLVAACLDCQRIK